MARVNLQEYCNEARELIAARAYDEAIAICRHILKRYPKHVKTYQILGEACLEKGEFQEAKDIFLRLLDHADPENFTAYAGLGLLAEREGNADQAIWYMERAFELAPSSDAVRDALRRLYGKRDGVEPSRIKLNKAALARLYARGGQYRQAIEEFRNLLALETNRDRVDLKVSLAETLWRDGRREQAAELSREVLQKSANCLKALLLLGKIEIDKGHREEGQSILEQARGLDPESLVAQALFAEQSPLLPQIVRIPRPEKPMVGVSEAETLSAVAAVEEAMVTAVPEVMPAPEEALGAEAVVAEVAEPVVIPEEVAEPAATEVMPTSEAEAAEPAVTLEEAAGPAVAEATPAPETGAAEPVVSVVEAVAGTGETMPEAPQSVAVPTLEQIAPAAKDACAEQAALAPGTTISAALVSDVECYKQHLEQHPKDDPVRLALARAYHKQEQMRLALEQYSLLLPAKSEILPKVISDMEMLVASRPDYMEAQELLADLYMRAGRLQEAVDRYRWILKRIGQTNA